MGLVPTKLQIFLLCRKFLRFVVTRPAREGQFSLPPSNPQMRPIPNQLPPTTRRSIPFGTGHPGHPLRGAGQEARLPRYMPSP